VPAAAPLAPLELVDELPPLATTAAVLNEELPPAAVLDEPAPTT
jgi:hypothetical protein